MPPALRREPPSAARAGSARLLDRHAAPSTVTRSKLGREAQEVTVAILDDELPKTPGLVFGLSDDLDTAISIDAEETIEIVADMQPQIHGGIDGTPALERLEANVHSRSRVRRIRT